MADETPRLTYFAGRGFAEPIRLALVAAGIEYTDNYLETRDGFLQLIKDEKLMFKQVPLLKIEGKTLIGAEPILRFVCRRGRLDGKTDEEKTQIDMLTMGAKDLAWPNIINSKFDEIQVSKEKCEEDIKSAFRECRHRYLPVFEKVLSESNSGFLVGESLSMADIMVFDALAYVKEIPELQPLLADFPRCAAFIEHFSNQPMINAYLASPRRHPPTDTKHATDACRILGWLP
ncbi:glutathione S-transferase alpha-4-like [Lytechinus pictus]|uniref:glutathione S-transferase alpha-4-like n=1 Tax=Lytechinus pictus TaxID=7653 RepID=UPI0030BA1A08